MQTTANRRQNGDNYKLETNWRQAYLQRSNQKLGDKLETVNLL